MKNKIKIFIIALIVIGIIASIYLWSIKSKFKYGYINNCNSDSDCIVVSSYCSSASAINKAYTDVWNKHLEESNKREIKQRKPCIIEVLSLDYYEAKCVNNKCIAKLINA